MATLMGGFEVGGGKLLGPCCHEPARDADECVVARERLRELASDSARGKPTGAACVAGDVACEGKPWGSCWRWSGI